MLLQGKNAIIYGAAGSIGGAVARAYAREGASVFLAGRTLAKLDRVADEIRSGGGVAETAQVDAMDQLAVDAHADQVAKAAGSIDISFNAISITAVQNTPLVEMSLEDFMAPIVEACRTHFATTTTAARHMTAQGSGVIVLLSSSAALESRHQTSPVAAPAADTSAACSERHRLRCGEICRRGLPAVSGDSGGAR